jgi:hypothetical protein
MAKYDGEGGAINYTNFSEGDSLPNGLDTHSVRRRLSELLIRAGRMESTTPFGAELERLTREAEANIAGEPQGLLVGMMKAGGIPAEALQEFLDRTKAAGVAVEPMDPSDPLARIRPAVGDSSGVLNSIVEKPKGLGDRNRE